MRKEEWRESKVVLPDYEQIMHLENLCCLTESADRKESVWNHCHPARDRQSTIVSIKSRTPSISALWQIKCYLDISPHFVIFRLQNLLAQRNVRLQLLTSRCIQRVIN